MPDPIAPDVLDIEDAQLLTEYLRELRRIGTTECPKVTVLAGGVSNRTVLVEREPTDCHPADAWVLKQALHKLRVQADWFCDVERIGREAAGLRWLAELAPAGATTPLVFEDQSHHLLAMQAVPQPHENWKTVLLAGRLEADHVRQFAELLATVHRGAAERKDELLPVFAERCYFEALRLEPYYQYTAEQVPDTADFLTKLSADTLGRPLTLVHGDYSPKNVLVHAGRLVLLDHEVIHWGDPAFDVGFALTHLLSKAHHLAANRDAFAGAAKSFWKTYREGIGDGEWSTEIEPMSVRHTLGCLLARVAGRSPLEYLTEAERAAQRSAVVGLMASSPASIDEMVERFVRSLR